MQRRKSSIFKRSSSNTVTLYDARRDMAERCFWVPPGGGAVREIKPGRDGVLGAQVCNQLAPMGPTLSATPDGLLVVIKREYKSRESKYRRAGYED